jgi:nucleotide-binding universal stress UspA family protein
VGTTVFTEFVTYAVGGGSGGKEQLWQAGTAIVETTKKIFLQANVPVQTKIIEGPAPEVILREASDGGYDLIAMGSRGIGTGVVQRTVFGLGSVAERVTSNASCPVLVVREKR